MNKELIRDLAITGGIYDCICDPYDKLKNGDHHSSVMIDLERFAEKIVRECVKVAVFKDSGTVATTDVAGHMAAGRSIAAQMIKEHFGVEE